MDIPTVITLVQQSTAAISGAIGAIDTGVKAVHSLLGPRDRELVAAIDEAKANITMLTNLNLSLAQEANALHEANVGYKAKIAQIEKFDVDAERYVSKTFGNGTFAKVLKDPGADPNGVERLCPQCFANKKYSLFTFQKQEFYFDIWQCVNCTMNLYVPNERKPTVSVSKMRSYGPFGDF